jgi:hypothetical protein
VNRALEKLRYVFNKQGVASTTAIIAGTISSNSVQAAPVALTKSVAAAAFAKGAGASVSTLALMKGALKIMAWTKTQTVIIASACVLLLAGTTATIIVCSQTRPMHSIPNDWTTLDGDFIQWGTTNGAISGHSNSGESILASSKEYHNVTLSATVSTPNREATLAVRLQDARNGYFVVFVPYSSDYGLINLMKRLDGDETVLASYQGQLRSAMDRTAKITVSAQGSLIEVRLSDTPVLRVVDTTFPRGLVGFKIFGDNNWPCDAVFSKVKLLQKS